LDRGTARDHGQQEQRERCEGNCSQQVAHRALFGGRCARKRRCPGRLTTSTFTTPTTSRAWNDEAAGSPVV